MKKLLLTLPMAAALALSMGANAEVDEAAAQQLLKSKPCLACHTVDTKLVGPAYKDVSAKYSDIDAVDTVAKNIKDGSSGQWGAIPMPQNPVTDEEAQTLAKYILSL